MGETENAEHLQTHCGKPLRWDPLATGTTCGGLDLEGALACDTCGALLIGPGSKSIERWKINGGGRSVDTGYTRIRAEGYDGAQALFARIVKLPEYERALRLIAAGAPNARELAAALVG